MEKFLEFQKKFQDNDIIKPETLAVATWFQKGFLELGWKGNNNSYASDNSWYNCKNILDRKSRL